MNKYGVEEDVETVNTEKQAALQSKDAVVRCPRCQVPVLPPENYGGLLVCPNHGTRYFETK